MSAQKEGSPRHEYFFEENGRLLVRLNYFVGSLAERDSLSESEKIITAFLLGQMSGINRILAWLDDLGMAVKFLYDNENVKEYAKLSRAVTNHYYEFVGNEIKHPDDFIYLLGLIENSFENFAFQALKSVKSKGLLD